MGNHEWCFYGWREGAAHYFNPEITNATDVWSVRKVAPPSMIHLTEKPVELAERAMQYSSRRDEHVLDLFGGSRLDADRGGASGPAGVPDGDRPGLLRRDRPTLAGLHRGEGRRLARERVDARRTSVARASSKTREEARRLYLTGDVDHERGDRRALEGEAAHRRPVAAGRRTGTASVGRSIAGPRRCSSRRSLRTGTQLNAQHFQLWGLVVTQLLGALKGASPRRRSGTSTRRRGFSIAPRRGSASPAALHWTARPRSRSGREAQAEIRHLIDVFIDTVKENVATMRRHGSVFAGRSSKRYLMRRASGAGDAGDAFAH